MIELKCICKFKRISGSYAHRPVTRGSREWGLLVGVARLSGNSRLPACNRPLATVPLQCIVRILTIGPPGLAADHHIMTRSSGRHLSGLGRHRCLLMTDWTKKQIVSRAERKAWNVRCRDFIGECSRQEGEEHVPPRFAKDREKPTIAIR